MANVPEQKQPANAGQTEFDPTSAKRARVVEGVPAELQASSKYEILGKLGEGGMGAVYKARHTLLERVLALKVLHPEVVGDSQARGRFLGEIRAVGQLDHKHIVPARDAEQMGELLVLAMDFVDGVSLDRLVAQKGALPASFACQCAMQAALGLQHAHDKGMVHRDIKPSNLMVTRADKEVKVLDFGLVQLPKDQGIKPARTQLQTFMGTPEYVAPEQAADARGADNRADIYSLGCTLYYLLAGRPPFKGDTLLATILAHVEHEPPPLMEIPEELWQVLARMLAKKPEERYGSAREVAQALLPFTKAGPKRVEMVPPPLPMTQEIQAEQTAPTQVMRHRRQRRPPLRLLVGGVLAGVLTLLLVAWLTLGDGAGSAKTGGKKTTGKVKKEDSTVTPVAWPAEVENSIGMRFVQVKAGRFRMGSPVGEAERDADEEPHDVELTKDYWLGIYEVTQEQYERVMDKNPSYFGPDGDGKGDVAGMNTKTFPVEFVSWQDAEDFCDALSRMPAELKAGRKYRLPTEAEWEYACRGGHLQRTYQVFHFGDSLSSSQANFHGNYPYGGAAKGDYLKRTCKVGSYRANALGLYDMHGNVLEWCSDWYASDYYGKSPARDPQGASVGVGRVVRGGGWDYYGTSCRSADRHWLVPGSRFRNFGFRIAQVPSR